MLFFFFFFFLARGLTKRLIENEQKKRKEKTNAVSLSFLCFFLSLIDGFEFLISSDRDRRSSAAWLNGWIEILMKLREGAAGGNSSDQSFSIEAEERRKKNERRASKNEKKTKKNILCLLHRLSFFQTFYHSLRLPFFFHFADDRELVNSLLLHSREITSFRRGRTTADKKWPTTAMEQPATTPPPQSSRRSRPSRWQQLREQRSLCPPELLLLLLLELELELLEASHRGQSTPRRLSLDRRRH